MVDSTKEKAKLLAPRNAVLPHALKLPAFNKLAG